ncbi:hypothetical protein HMN09_00924600 [Mycena chlorophos]|uniref:Uncharacterized protein n=1 Tax=Mycena chlorophos TaxID=658473 RepID=A0A8H6SJB2_MYCCL|nr:hypothetical protein HMN09_00924600 [Mycena chlorophos]
MLSVEEPEWRQFASSVKHHFAFAGVDFTRTWTEQDPQVISSVFEAAEAALPQLRRAEDNWMLKSILWRHFSSLRYKHTRYPKEEKVSRSSVQWDGKAIPCPRDPTRIRIKRIRELLGVDSREWYGIRASLRHNAKTIGLDFDKVWAEQDQDLLRNIVNAVEDDCPILRRAADQWITRLLAYEHHRSVRRDRDRVYPPHRPKPSSANHLVPSKLNIRQLRARLGLDSREWARFRYLIHQQILSVNPDWSKGWAQQDQGKIDAVYREVRAGFPSLPMVPTRDVLWYIPQVVRRVWEMTRRRDLKRAGASLDN